MSYTLDRDSLKDIDSQLPNLSQLGDKALGPSRGFIEIMFAPPPERTIPLAAVCLEDTLHVLYQARFAMHECLAYRKQYLEIEVPPKEHLAVFYSRFFLDDVALRLYSASEHLATAIQYMLEIPDDRLKNKDSKTPGSRFIRLKTYLNRESPDHVLSRLTKSLVGDKQWKQTVNYRNSWVHEQPPTVEGTGIVYRRRSGWKRFEHYHELQFGGGDKPQYTVQSLIDFILPSLHCFTATFSEAVDYYYSLLNEHGISWNDNTNS